MGCSVPMSPVRYQRPGTTPPIVETLHSGRGGKIPAGHGLEAQIHISITVSRRVCLYERRQYNIPAIHTLKQDNRAFTQSFLAINRLKSHTPPAFEVYVNEHFVLSRLVVVVAEGEGRCQHHHFPGLR